MSKLNELKVTRVRNVKLPTRANNLDCGYDIYMPADLVRMDMVKTFEITKVQPRVDYDMSSGYLKNLFIAPGEDILIPTGLKIRVPEGYVLKIENKSGVAATKSLIVGSCIVDCGYTGEILINLHNVSDKKVAVLNPQDKICQFVLYRCETPEIVEVATPVELFKDLDSSRGEGGFGSTDRPTGITNV